MEHMLRSCVLGVRLSDEMGLPVAQRDRVFYATLLAWIGCHADSYELAKVFGDDIGFRAGTYAVDKRGLPLMAFLLGRVAAAEPAFIRAPRTLAFLATGRNVMNELIRSHCLSAGTLARRVGIDDEVGRLLGYTFERWDGAGLPHGSRGQDIPVEIRIVHLVDTAEVYLREGGRVAAERMLRRRRGTQFDPDLVDVFCTHADQLTAGVQGEDAWSVALAFAPPDRVVDEAELDAMLVAMGDFVDLKSPYTAGHSRAVASLAEQAGACAGLDGSPRRALRRAGLVHDLGRMGVSNSIWDKAAPLSTSDRERIQLHPYLTERVLHRVSGLGDIARLAGAHHERLDGSGYPRGVGAADLGETQRILAAADSYQAWREPRPHRAALSAEEAAVRLRQQAADLRLDGSAVEAVLAAAGHRTPRRRRGPAGLTGRELEILRLLVRGRSTKQIAAELVIAEKTVRNHVEHIYAKLGVANRISATLFALQHGLMGHPDDAPERS